MTDIGTDHGFLPIYLIENNISPRVIMTDISEHSLAKAKANYFGAGPLTFVSSGKSRAAKSSVYNEPKEPAKMAADFRTGDGLSVLRPGETDVVVMAGIGGRMIEDILSADPAKSRSFKKFILQPRKHIGMLRCFLCSNGYSIEKEDLVREGKFICEILSVRPNPEKAGYISQMHRPADSIHWEVPEYYAVKDHPLAEEYIQRKLERERFILKAKEGSDDADKALTVYNIEYLIDLLRRRKQNEV